MSCYLRVTERLLDDGIQWVTKEKKVTTATLYPKQDRLKNIAIGILFGVARIQVGKLFFATPILASASPLGVAFFFLFSCVVAPLAEEVVFRHHLMNRISKHCKQEGIKNTQQKVIAVAVSAILFGAMRAFIFRRTIDESRVFSAIVGGFFYGTARVLTGNLWASTVAHSLFNANAYLNLL